MALHKKLSSNDIELNPINKPNDNENNGNGITGIISGGNSNNNSVKMPSKKIQFTTPEFSITPIETLPGGRPRPALSRKREEAMVMANLRKRVAACDLNKNYKREPPAVVVEELIVNDTGQTQDQIDSRPLLPKKDKKDKNDKKDKKDKNDKKDKSEKNDGEESPKARIMMDKDFILDCLCWHNEYRARHGAPALSVSAELCDYANRWATHLATTNELYYQHNSHYGQNIFCCPANSLLTDLSGQEVATYWYSTNRRYNYFKENSLLHTNVNTGHFTQIVWRNSKYFGVSKSISKTGKLFVVAYYYPAGNVIGEFRQNVLPPIMANDEANLSRPASSKDLEHMSASH